VEENLSFYADRNLWTGSKKGQEKIGLDGPVIKALIKGEQNKKWAINIFGL
jgi:hypothetical protein